MDLPIQAPAAADAPPPFLLFRPAMQVAPVILASPHSGRHYTAAFLAESRLDPVALRRSEDGFVEELFADAPAHGTPLLAATFPRVYCDANREPWELDPGMFDGPLPDFINSASPRVSAGLGTIARVVASGETVYRRRLSFEEAAGRIRGLWEPYHAALSGLIGETTRRFGCCLLIDCHSMPSLPGEPGRTADMILGDAHGTAAAPRATRMLEEALTELGYRLRRNDPYAGGYVTRHYGRPREGVHVIQLEIARSLYMDERRIQRLPGIETLRADMERLVKRLVQADWSFLRP
ncbi:N-formylglutamate amidohydrolase [Roseomonas xinghualingensis]|uniref:N-formylglutamate amidohydrolase n=1 Tax=Roseomonas xinghualingensis TaxID=2986475 RepID=UPI0021F0C576|nr:N-formylglutamate amidohydrolase [Roseomonas sp. SXEYE001]MCV4210382.1 N-formylglutamate amidohydrolase [Roseomonas sp. SXEYE001]